MLKWNDVVAIGTALPGVEESTSYGTPALKVRGKLLVRLKEDGESIVVLTPDLDSKEALLAGDSDVFFTTPHYDGHASVLARLARLRRPLFEELLRDVYTAVAPKKRALAAPRAKKGATTSKKRARSGP